MLLDPGNIHIARDFSCSSDDDDVMSVDSSISDISEAPDTPKPTVDTVPYSGHSSNSLSDEGPPDFPTHINATAQPDNKMFTIPRRSQFPATGNKDATEHRSPLNRVYGHDTHVSKRQFKFRGGPGRQNFFPSFKKAYAKNHSKWNRFSHRDHKFGSVDRRRKSWGAHGLKRNQWTRQNRGNKDQVASFFHSAKQHAAVAGALSSAPPLPPFETHRNDHGAAFDHTLLPVPSLRASFTAMIPSATKIQAEKYTDGMVKSMLDKACSHSDLVSKSIPRDKIAARYEAIKSFLQNSINRDTWVSVRKEEIAHSGLVNLIAFMEETISWLQIKLENIPEYEKPRGDIILSCSSFLCKQIMSSLRPLAQCCLRDPGERAIFARLSQLVIEGRVLHAGLFLQTLTLKFHLGILAAMAITPYILLQPDLPRHVDPAPHMSKFITAYRPGYLMGLLNTIIQQHDGHCKSQSCRSDVKATVISEPACKGLFFFPLYEKK
ncbi:multifunctional expression regulator [Common bottlenose dolphin gammaherpesvirus 1 strain Sarasota]|uniref:Multifunctional expression regulator n=1 Tax=Common bottlenose dolphin gammaherpesvirus 1 strain Sarasota TaxID=2022783 RepID=A0A1Z1NEA1_9GAMA|nr:multifunctional expression regulator [Common bottlenose dolphin gammaherpesvirus 1 strain Sarasota]ARW78119.1 multifunctional expression regulator [Common bottlenose dolphin gammaherpesvirus 1 strain Sarasota]